MKLKGFSQFKLLYAVVNQLTIFKMINVSFLSETVKYFGFMVHLY